MFEKDWGGTQAMLPVRHNAYLHELVWELLRTRKPGKLLDVPSGPWYFAKLAGESGFDAVAAKIDPSVHVLPGVAYASANMGKSFPFWRAHSTASPRSRESSIRKIHSALRAATIILRGRSAQTFRTYMTMSSKSATPENPMRSNTAKSLSVTSPKK